MLYSIARLELFSKGRHCFVPSKSWGQQEKECKTGLPHPTQKMGGSVQYFWYQYTLDSLKHTMKQKSCDP